MNSGTSSPPRRSPVAVVHLHTPLRARGHGDVYVLLRKQRARARVARAREGLDNKTRGALDSELLAAGRRWHRVLVARPRTVVPLAWGPSHNPMSRRCATRSISSGR